MPAVDIPGAKRAGLPVDLDRLTAEGDDWLSAEERYALKQHGVCAQHQPHVFMLRCRTGGAMSPDQARAMARAAEARGHGWLHLTTRQQIELHHVAAREVTAAIGEVEQAGLTTSSTCGHAVRGVMWCPDAGVGLDEPFDCRPDAEATTAAMLARTPKLNHQLPQRLNIAFGGCPACRAHAGTNDLAFVSAVGAGGELGYEVWVGGSLGKSAPTLGHRLRQFVPRTEVLPLVNGVLDVFTALGAFDVAARVDLRVSERLRGRVHPLDGRVRGAEPLDPRLARPLGERLGQRLPERLALGRVVGAVTVAPFGAAQGVTEVLPEARLQGRDRHVPAVGALVDVVPRNPAGEGGLPRARILARERRRRDRL
jgi:dissimilatory sulfite reductase (desulfoviridin) alpha/beta subunit